MTMPVMRGRLAGIAAVCAGLAIVTSACAINTSGTGGTASPGATAPTTLASNGIAAKPAAKIVKTAFATLESAESVRLYGSFRDSGARYKLDITLGPAGMRGTMTGPFQSKQATVGLVVAHGKLYARSSTLWRRVGGAGLASLIGDRWVILPVGKLSGFPFASAKTFINDVVNQQILKSLKNAIAHVARVKTTVDGQPAIELSGGGYVVYIATTGQPYPLEIRQGSRNVLHFQYSRLPVSIAAPPHAIDLSSLHG